MCGDFHVAEEHITARRRSYYLWSTTQMNRSADSISASNPWLHVARENLTAEPLLAKHFVHDISSCAKTG